jgi:hypothetical protein
MMEGILLLLTFVGLPLFLLTLPFSLIGIVSIVGDMLEGKA